MGQLHDLHHDLLRVSTLYRSAEYPQVDKCGGDGSRTHETLSKSAKFLAWCNRPLCHASVQPKLYLHNTPNNKKTFNIFPRSFVEKEGLDYTFKNPNSYTCGRNFSLKILYASSKSFIETGGKSPLALRACRAFLI